MGLKMAEIDARMMPVFDHLAKLPAKIAEITMKVPPTSNKDMYMFLWLIGMNQV